MEKRIVLLHVTGPKAGIHEISGIWAEDKPLPSEAKDVPFEDGRTGSALLVKTTQKYAIYREVA